VAPAARVPQGAAAAAHAPNNQTTQPPTPNPQPPTPNLSSQVRGLVRQHIDSFNYLINTEMREIVHANRRVVKPKPLI